jgi:glucoamylase
VAKNEDEAKDAFRADPARSAPGRPGVEPRWAPGAKDGVGTAIGGASLVWFTIGQGVLTEVFYPNVDEACTRDLELIVTDGEEFFSDERTDAAHAIENPHEGVPLYRVVNTCHQGRYRIEKTILAHRDQHAVLQVARFEALAGGPYRLYAVLSPMLGARDEFEPDDAWLAEHRGVPMFFARHGSRALALACSPDWITGSAGYAGKSDGRRDLARHKRLTKLYGKAERGNSVLTGEIDLAARGGEFTLALGFGSDAAEAGHHALAALLDDAQGVRGAYVQGWRDWQEAIDPPRPPAGARDLARVSASVLKVHEALMIPGAIVASLSTPWGEAQGPDQFLAQGGYHLVWPRDLVEAAGGLLAAGARREAMEVLGYLRATQMADGHWPQNMWAAGMPYWDGIQLGETALPVLLLDLLRRRRVVPEEEVPAFWPMVRRAVGYIVRSGPATQQDRWENQQGYTPFTLGSVIAALLVAADLADERNESAAAAYLRETADDWNAAIESWLYITGTGLAETLGIEGYYLRTVPPELDEISTPGDGHLTLKTDPPGLEGVPVSEVVSVDALALVRFGLRRPDDPRIVNTLKAIDATLRVETPRGPSWRRYVGDGYGEHPDGSPFTHRNDTFGRAWPLLVGERGHYELMAGRRDEAERLARAMADQAGDGGMIPEQVWDADDIPAKGLFKGRPSGSAAPLAWAHAEYLKLLRSLHDGAAFDLPPQTVRRYLEQRVASYRVIWRPEHPRKRIAAGEVIRVVLGSPAQVEWSADRWATTHRALTRDSTLGAHYADLETKDLPAGTTLRMTFHADQEAEFDGKKYKVEVT